MATIHVSQLQCVRKQDATGAFDESAIFLAGREAIVLPMAKGQVRPLDPHLSETFGASIVVELKEKDGNSYKSLGSTTVLAGIQGPQPVEFKTSGAHYHLWYHLL